MQFSLKHLMWAMTMLCILIGLIVASPPVLSLPILILCLLALPGVTLTGMIWASGRLRAFFIGAGATAFLPLIWAAFFTFAQGPSRARNIDNLMWQPAIKTVWITFHLTLAAPIISGSIGGIAAGITFGFVNSTPPQVTDSAKE